MGSFNPFANPKSLLPVQISTAIQSSSFVSNILSILDLTAYSLQVDITNQSGLTSAIEVQGSLDGQNWATVPGSSVAFSSNTSYIWDNSRSGIPFIRLSVTISAGSAQFNMFGYAKL